VARAGSIILPTAQCSRGTNQSRPFPARSLKVMESAGQIDTSRRGAREIGKSEVPTVSTETGRIIFPVPVQAFVKSTNAPVHRPARTEKN
jgi:hypothetical protein